MKKTLSLLLAAALLAAVLLAGACAKGNKTLNAYIDRQSAAAVDTVKNYLDGGIDAEAALDALQKLADDAAADKAETPLKEILEKDVADDAAFTVFESQLQLLISNFSHYLLMERGYAQGLVTEEDHSLALENHRAALEKQIGEDER